MKVLITGPWQEASNNYSCRFDQISVPASLIQPGVLRCYCPGERPPPGRGRRAQSAGPRVSLEGVTWSNLCHSSGPPFPPRCRSGSRISDHNGICSGLMAQSMIDGDTGELGWVLKRT